MSLVSRSLGLGHKVVTKLAQFVPDPAPDPLSTSNAGPGKIGHPVDRIDGPVKAAGDVRYAADYQLEGTAYGVAVGSTIARGRIVEIDASDATAVPGVLLVMTHENAPRMKQTAAYATLTRPLAPAAMSLPILNTEEIFWNGQPVAVVVAETLEQAERAATLLRVRYESMPSVLSMDAEKPRAFTPVHSLLEESDLEIGDVKSAIAQAAVSVDNVYSTPAVNHNAMELHATLATWESGNLVVYDATQYPYGVKEMLAAKFGLPKRRVRVMSPFIGGGFGGKSAAWPHVALAAAGAAARASLAERVVAILLLGSIVLVQVPLIL
jgi:xanthine dehydrogenase YagR molybdenum-binding subunit